MSSNLINATKMINKINLKIEPRYVKTVGGGLRPFQKETLEAIADPSLKLIEVEAPVGSGKSYIFAKLLELPNPNNKPIIITYPTKILMDTQVSAIVKSLKGKFPVAVWPEDMGIFPIENGLNIFKYSSDSLITFFSQNLEAFEIFKLRGKLLGDGMFTLKYGQNQLFITTPDVLWLIYSGKFKGGMELQAQLNSALVFFDEFHVYADLYNFYNLIDELILKSKVDKIILLSATPFIRKKLWERIQDKLKKKQMKKKSIDFRGSLGSLEDQIFNYPLKIEIHNFRYTDRELSLKKISEILKQIQTPAAIIFDSISRLRHLRPLIEDNFKDKFQFREWSGMHKDED